MCGLARILGLAIFFVCGAAAAQVDAIVDIRLGRDTAATTTSPERLAYQQQTAMRIDSWRSRIDNRTALAATGGSESEIASGARLTDAWQNVNDHWQALQEADDAEWERFKRELDTALDDLEQAWRTSSAASEASTVPTAGDDDRPYFYAIDVATRMLT